MATSNRIRALNRLPFDFQDGLKVGGVDVTNLNQAFTPAGAGLIGFTPVGGISATNVQAAIQELDTEKTSIAALATAAGAAAVGFTPIGNISAATVQAALAELDSEKAVKTDLSATTGSGLVGYDGGTVQDVLDSAKPMADYIALRAYAGRATSVRITSNGLSGFFYYDAADTSSADNGGTVIVSSNGKRWKRLFNDAVFVSWFGASKTGAADNNTVAIQAAANYCETNNFIPLGVAGLRWSEVFATNGVINTSDLNFKEQVRELSDVEKNSRFKMQRSIARL